MTESEFIYHPPCGNRVWQRGFMPAKLLGFCTRRSEHTGKCTHLVDDRTTHNLRTR